jgi:hypothetical protein
MSGEIKNVANANVDKMMKLLFLSNISIILDRDPQ